MKFRLNWLTRLSLVVALLSASATAFGAAVTVTYNGVKYKSDKSQTYFMVVAAPYTGDIVVADSVKCRQDSACNTGRLKRIFGAGRIDFSDSARNSY